MNDLHTWLSQQHHGLRTFRTFQQKLDDASKSDPEQRALCRLLNTVVGSYVDTFDEEPLPVAVRISLTVACSNWWPAWTSAQALTGAWPISTVWQPAICGIKRPVSAG